MASYFGVRGGRNHRYQVGTTWFGRKVVELLDHEGDRIAAVYYVCDGVRHHCDLKTLHRWVLKQTLKQTRQREFDLFAMGATAAYQIDISVTIRRVS